MAAKVNGPSVAHERPSSFISLLSGWAEQGLESFFATQRILVDLALRQNTNAMKTFREGLSKSEAEAKDSSMKIVTEVVVEGTANYIEAQRILLDLAQQENEIVMNGVRERVGEKPTAVALTNVIRRSIDTFIEMQQNFLVLASKRTQGMLQADGNSKGVNGLAGLAGEAMDEFVAAQQKFFDVISEETKWDENGKKDHAGKKMHKTELTELGREVADSFIDAQKKLLDLAGQQVNVNMQAASRAYELRTPINLLPVADIAGGSVKSFVDAEKALLTSMTKARAKAKETVSHKAAAKPAARRAKARAKATKAAHKEMVEV